MTVEADPDAGPEQDVDIKAWFAELAGDAKLLASLLRETYGSGRETSFGPDAPIVEPPYHTSAGA
jgi:hypothetical protein